MIAIVGEAPGATEVDQGRPFCGDAGRNLDGLLDDAGLSRDAIWITNAVTCRPFRSEGKRPVSQKGNVEPSAKAVEACRAGLDDELATVQPGAILALGVPATRRFLGGEPTLGSLVDQVISYNLIGQGVPLMATYHPSPLSTNRDRSRLCMIQRAIGKAVSLGEARLNTPREG